jgi:2-phosphosulfolactate phosphatase
VAVIIDVFRAFTTAAFVMNNGAERILPVLTVGEGLRLKREHPEYVLMGEREGLKVEGFDYGNSPFLVKDVDFTGKTVIQTTSAGTKGVVSAMHADEVLLGSFVNAQATVDYIRKARPSVATLVAMGYNGTERREEDELCAGYMKARLENKTADFGKIREFLKTYKSATGYFLDPAKPQFPEEDFHCALDLNKFNFILKAGMGEDGRISVRKEPV